MIAILTTLMIAAAALSADLIIETSAELSADTLLDVDAGATYPLTPAQPTEIVDLAPRATLPPRAR